MAREGSRTSRPGRDGHRDVSRSDYGERGGRGSRKDRSFLSSTPRTGLSGVWTRSEPGLGGEPQAASDSDEDPVAGPEKSHHRNPRGPPRTPELKPGSRNGGSPSSRVLRNSVARVTRPKGGCVPLKPRLPAFHPTDPSVSGRKDDESRLPGPDYLKGEGREKSPGDRTDRSCPGYLSSISLGARVST